jgi:predicted esterase YcpF (UPF0227 family)
MTTLLYLHGFLSSPESSKAIQVRDWLAANRPDIEYVCPYVPSKPPEAHDLLKQVVGDLLPGPLCVMGSSLGGYWATWIAEQHDLRAVLINPAIETRSLDPEYVGVELNNYHNDDTVVLTSDDIDLLCSFSPEVISRPENYFLMVQTGDEVLDYRLAVDKYAGSRQLVEQGGDHGFQDFERHIAQSIEFLVPTAT